MNRRHFLMLAGGGVVVAAGVGVAGFVTTRTPSKALAPWSIAGASQYSEPRLRALSYAILAPNPHNQQPWLVEMIGEDQIKLHANPAKMLPHTDPLSRQITIGLGCFLELMEMAAAQDGYRVDTELFPQGEDPERITELPVAVARFVKDRDVKPDPLFAHVMDRRSNKEPFDTTKPVSKSVLDALVSSNRHRTKVNGSVEAQVIEALRVVTTNALKIEIDTPRTYKESVDVFRIGKREINTNPDGIDFSGPLFEIMGAIGLFSRELSLDRTSTAFIQGLQSVLENPKTSMGFVWMTTSGNNRKDQITAGRDWLRVNLEATRQGIGFHPLSQALQEYEEMKTVYRGIHQRLSPEGGTVQMLVRIGYGQEIPASPRWPLESKII